MATTAKDYFKSADGHRRAVELLHPHEFKADGNRGSLFFAIYNLLGFTVELYLKAFLAKEGVQEAELRSKKYGHKLSKLFDEAKKRGFAVCLADMEAIVKFLDSGHGQFGYRYVQDGGTLNYFNDLTPVVEALRNIHVSLQGELT